MRNYADDNDLHYMWNKIHVKVNQKASELELAIDESARHGRIVKIVVQHCLANARSLITGQTFDDIQYSPWQDTLPEYISGKYYWARSVIYYVDGTIVYSDPYFDMGAQVTAEVNIAVQEAMDTADEAKLIAQHGKVVKIIIQHCLANARSLITGQTFADIQYSSWQEDIPDYVAGKYYWARMIIYYADGTVMYSDPYFDMEAQVTAEVNIAVQEAQETADEAERIAREASQTAGQSRKVFNTTPTPPYAVNDLWFDSAHGLTYLCSTAKAEGGTFAQSDWTVYSTDVSSHFWYDSSGAHIAENQGDVTTGASQTIASTGTVMMRNGKVITSWTGTNSGDAAINFYDLSSSMARDADLVASYGRAGITHYINNVVCQALTASGLSFFNPNSANPSNPDLEAVFGPAGTELYAGGKKTMSSTADYMTFYDTTTLEEVAKFGKDIAKIGRDGARHIVIDSNGLRLYNGNGAEALANLGYGLGKDASGNNVIAPYFTLGVRNSSTVGNYSMVEGRLNSATAYCAHAEGNGTSAEAPYSHTEGMNTRATANSAHAGGIGNTANGEAQTVIGKYATIPDYENDLVLVGNGTDASNRSNAVRLQRSGYVEFAGPVGSRLYFADIPHMITYATPLNLYEPYLFTAGTTWGNQAGTGSYRAFGIIYKLSTTSYHLLFSSIGGKAYRSVFTVDSSDSTTGTFNTSQLDETSLSAAASTNAIAATPMADVSVPEVQGTENSEI